MKKLIQQLLHLSFLNPPSLRRRQSGYDASATFPSLLPSAGNRWGEGGGEANQIKSRGDYSLCFNKIPYLNRLALSIIENPKIQMAK
jgi:hypothetical protein